MQGIRYAFANRFYYFYFFYPSEEMSICGAISGYKLNS